MANLPVYVLDKDLMPELRARMQQASLDLQEIGLPTRHTEGAEQNWKCSDKSGDLFYFSACEVDDKNGLGLKAGTFCLISGPPARKRVRKEIADAFKRFEDTLMELGARRLEKG